MGDNLPRAIYRIENAEAEHSAYARYMECYQRSLAILRVPRPDTFLGRKTQEPFLLQDDQPIAILAR